MKRQIIIQKKPYYNWEFKGVRMTKYEIWKDFKKRVKIARKIRDTQKKNIIRCEWMSSGRACIKIIRIQDLDMITDGITRHDIIEKKCKNFNGYPCKNKNCPMYAANHEYIHAELLLSKLKRARNRAFWNMFTRSK